MDKRIFCLLMVSLTLLFTQCVSQSELNGDHLVGWWTFDDGAGTIAADSSGKSVDGVLKGEPAWDSEGKFGGSLTFDGKDDWVFIDGDFQLPVYTISLWFRAEMSFRNTDIFSAYAPGVRHGILLEVRDEGIVRFLDRYPLATTGGVSIYSNETVKDNTWHHVAAVKTTDSLTLYLDGYLIETVENPAATDSEDGLDVILGILDHERNIDRQWLGGVDEVRIYDAPLSESLIMELAGY